MTVHLDLLNTIVIIGLTITTLYYRDRYLKERAYTDTLENQLMIKKDKEVTGFISSIMRAMGFETHDITTLDALKYELLQAEENENFERAAEIKKEIEELESKSNNNNPDLL